MLAGLQACLIVLAVIVVRLMLQRSGCCGFYSSSVDQG
jgi:hypothetical protein